MATIIFFHAHPDDECIATGGVMVKAATEGHRVVLVVATKGEKGEVDPAFLDEDESLGERRVEETLAAAKVLGVARTEFLGYVDSGMMGTPENDAPDSFWQADVEEAAERLAVILREERADILVTYDDHGGYGHPDHIQVHRVGVRAAELADVHDVFEATMNRDETRRMIDAAREHGADMPGDVDPRSVEFGTPEAELTTRVDVSDYLLVKREAMTVHASQISETSWLLAMPPEAFTAAFGQEWFIHRGAAPGIREDRLL
jgi:LmbE family N-acetylglucosaminyl deacetylase